MSAAKHTPGPWHIDERYSGDSALDGCVAISTFRWLGLAQVNEVRGVIVVASAWPALAALPWWPL